MRRTRRQRATQAVANTQFTGLVGTGVGGDREGAHTCLPIQLPTCLQPAYTPTARPCLHTYGTPLPTHPRDAPANTPTARPCLHTHSTPLPTHLRDAPAYTPTGRPCQHTHGTPLPTHPRDAPANTPTARPCLARPCLHTYGTTLQQRPIVFRL